MARQGQHRTRGGPRHPLRGVAACRASTGARRSGCHHNQIRELLASTLDDPRCRVAHPHVEIQVERKPGDPRNGPAQPALGRKRALPGRRRLAGCGSWPTPRRVDDVKQLNRGRKTSGELNRVVDRSGRARSEVGRHQNARDGHGCVPLIVIAKVMPARSWCASVPLTDRPRAKSPRRPGENPRIGANSRVRTTIPASPRRQVSALGLQPARLVRSVTRATLRGTPCSELCHLPRVHRPVKVSGRR